MDIFFFTKNSFFGKWESACSSLERRLNSVLGVRSWRFVFFFFLSPLFKILNLVGFTGRTQALKLRDLGLNPSFQFSYLSGIYL